MTYAEFCKRARAYQNKTGMWRVEIDTSVPNRMVTTSTDYPCEKAQDEQAALQYAYTEFCTTANIAPERQQLDMFASTGRVDDLPLFSGTPQRVDASHFDPPTVSKAEQTKLF